MLKVVLPWSSSKYSPSRWFRLFALPRARMYAAILGGTRDGKIKGAATVETQVLFTGIFVDVPECKDSLDARLRAYGFYLL